MVQTVYIFYFNYRNVTIDKFMKTENIINR